MQNLECKRARSFGQNQFLYFFVSEITVSVTETTIKLCRLQSCDNEDKIYIHFMQYINARHMLLARNTKIIKFLLNTNLSLNTNELITYFKTEINNVLTKKETNIHVLLVESNLSERYHSLG